MMIDSPLFEPFAHHASGMATMSFAVWSVVLYRLRKRNRMMSLLFLVVAYITLCFAKDMVYLLPSDIFGSNFIFVENLMSIFDLCFIPLVCAFFLEATRPGVATKKRVLLSFIAFLAFAPLYGVLRTQWVMNGVFLLSLVSSIATLVIVPINAARYNKYLSDNYSYVKNISVRWCVGCTFGFFLLVVFYLLCFYEPTWLGEMLYDFCFVVVWNIVCIMGRNHRIVVGIMTFDERQNDKTDQMSTFAASDADKNKAFFFAESLQHCMETDRLYLNPQLSLADLAEAVNTNKTYVSSYINSQGKTFYDFVNEYRVEEACRIIDKMTEHGRVRMTDVAGQSGFNSVSTFNRYFVKIKDITPSGYLRHKS